MLLCFMLIFIVLLYIVGISVRMVNITYLIAHYPTENLYISVCFTTMNHFPLSHFPLPQFSIPHYHKNCLLASLSLKLTLTSFLLICLISSSPLYVPLSFTYLSSSYLLPFIALTPLSHTFSLFLFLSPSLSIQC